MTSIKFNQRKTIQRINLYIALISLAIVFAFPIFWLIFGAVKSNSDVFNSFVLIPAELQITNVELALQQDGFIPATLRSLFLSITYTVLSVFSSAIAGYAFARHRARGKRILFIILISTLLMPQTVTVIPQFVIFAKLDFIGTFYPWIFWGLSGVAWQIFLFRQFFAGFPSDLEDAAELDGCNRIQTLFLIFIPNSVSVLMVAGILAFNQVWGDYFTQTLLLTPATETLAMYVQDMRSSPSITFASAVLYALPPIILFIVAQRHIVRGVVTSGLR